MPYQVLARKWRPQTFSEVVGQEHLVRTLKNAIINDRIGSAYLFVGSRGIGKTTTARIFAKAINCTNPQDGEPCCQCDNCREIAAGNALDVVEFDAASHNGVDDIRDLREQVQYVPGKCKYKVFIIDEVHMLSNSAWNALLKTLEEPPPHVKFLFATTEPHKVLPTIISRCQRFDLRRISVPNIAARLRLIADNEHIFVDDDALAAIARAASGGMRDAQSILDQMIAFCGGLNADETIHAQDVANVFGLASLDELRRIAQGLFEHRLEQVLEVIASLADAGRDLERVFEDLVSYLRKLMIAGLCKDAGKFLEVSPDELNELVGLARTVQPRLIQHILSGFVARQGIFADSVNKRIAFEVLAAQVSSEAHDVGLDQILTHLNVLAGLIPPDKLPPVAVPAAAVTTLPPVSAPPAPPSPAPPPETKPEVPEVPAAKPEETKIVPPPAAVEPEASQPAEAVATPPPPPAPAEPAKSAAPLQSQPLSSAEFQETQSAQPTQYRLPSREELSALKAEPAAVLIQRVLNVDAIDGRIKL